MARMWNRQNADGTTTVIYEDGRLEVWNFGTGEKVREAAANQQLAAAMRAGDTNTMQDTIDYGTNWLASPMGQDYIQTRQAAADEDLRRWDKSFGVTEQNAGTNRYQAETGRYSAETSRMDTEARIKDLERKYGLDSSRLYLDYNKQAIDYSKTPRSWLDALDWERGGQGGGIPVYAQNLASNLTNPAFGAKGAGTPQMNSLGQSVADASGNPNVAATDPTNEVTKAIAQVARASPPSSTPGMSGRDAATVQLFTELYKGGAGKIGEGVWESLRPDEQDTALGVFDRVSPNGGTRWLQDMAATRIPRGSRAYAA